MTVSKIFFVPKVNYILVEILKLKFFSVRLGENGCGNSIDMDFVHHSLKKTSEEIQNYTFSGVDRANGSQDSGIVDFVDGIQVKFA